jgi:ABC-type polysaccharide/polyol phosphate export permease
MIVLRRGSYLPIGNRLVEADYATAVSDIVGGAMRWRMWGRLGWQEVKRRYRRTVIGPFWTTLSLAIFILSLGVVYSQLWHQPLETYLPFVSVGMICWTLVSALITDGCTVLPANEGLIKQLQVSFTLLTISIVWRNLIVFLHNLAIYLAVIVFFPVDFGLATLLVIPGILLVCLNGTWIGLILGMVCARFRDLQPLIGSVLSVALFVTPIFYSPDQLGSHTAVFVTFNPLFHLTDIVRSPLLGKYPAAKSWIFAVGLLIGGWWLALYLFARFRRRLAFWL